MKELKERLAALGLDQSKIDPVIQTVGNFVKEKVPAEYHATIDQVMAGESPSIPYGLMGKVKGLFGR